MNILQIGCNNGKDHVLEYIRSQNNIESIILVDASQTAINKCKETYKDISNCTFIHSAIVPDNVESIDLHYPINQEDSEHCSVNFDHLIRHNHSNIKTVTVPAININTLLETYKPIDRLYVDTEGLDSLLINAINFDVHKISYIYFEHLHSDGAFSVSKNYNRALNHLRTHLYKIQTIGINTEASLI